MLRNGFPERRAVERLPQDPTTRAMHVFDRAFLDANAGALDYYTSRWVADPMHTWSRPWEYLFTYERIRSLAGRLGASNLHVLDAGSGLTFFPHFVTSRHQGFTVHAIDNDARLVEDAARLSSPAEPHVTYEHRELEALDAGARPFDLVYCLSVLEHMADRSDAAITALTRALRPGGRLVLTIDVSIDGDAEIPLDAAARLVRDLGRALEPEGDFETAIQGLDFSRHYTTEHARSADPTLLPWAPPRFHHLTCFGMSFRCP